MKKYIYLVLISLMFITLLPSMGQNLEIIYPKNSSTINAASTFIVGNTDPRAKLTINDKPVEVYPNGSFVQVIGLDKGENKIEITSKLDNQSKNITYTLNVPTANPEKSVKKVVMTPITATAEVKNDMATVRTAPNASRLTPLPKGTLLSLNGKLGENYRYKLGENKEGWISQDNINILHKEIATTSEIKEITLQSCTDSLLIKIPLAQKLPINIDELAGPKMALKIYGGTANINLIHYNDPFIKEIKWIQEDKDTFKLLITPNSTQFWGYDYYYEDNTLVLKLRKPPVAAADNPLKDKIITIDPGHGGSESGSVGPTGVPEKTVNLAIAGYLKEYLEICGAKVIMTRTSDSENPGLYKRGDIAKENNSQLLVSIHNNALPDGHDPYIEHGSSTYYYHPQSLPLAKSIQQSMVQNLGLKDYGVFWDSLALTRPSSQLSVLVEVGFMINPEEYALLINPDFQKKAARSIYLGIENFYKNNASN